MKLIVLLIIAISLQASAATYAQKITINEQKTPLSTVFRDIHEQSGYIVFFNKNLLENLPPVTVKISNASIEEILDRCLDGLPLTYTIVDNTIVIKKKEVKIIEQTAGPVKSQQKQTIISGKVTDEENNTLPGVTIKIKGTKSITVTNQNGVFALVISSPDDVLQFTFIGYVTQEISAGQLKNPGVIVMKTDISKLDEVQVIGYGTTTRRANTGDVTTVDSKTIAQYPTNNVLDVLQGTVPGLNITQSTGNVTGTYSVNLRGINGLKARAPMYVVDGVIYQSGSWTSNNGTSGTVPAAYDIMGLINPDDIESVSVLKDADATAIYGSRGADGVILITTKKGKIGAVRIDGTVYTGVNDVAHTLPVLNLQQYLQMRHQAKANDNSAILPTDYDINGVWDTTRSTNWQKELIGGFGHNTNAQLAVSGGSEQTQYRISGGYNYTSSLEHLGGNDQKANLNVSLTSATKDKKFSITFSGGYLFDINTMPQADLTGDIILAPDAPALYTSTGALNFQNNTFSNPLLIKNDMNNTSQNNLVSSLVLSYKPVKDLEIELTTGYNKQGLNEFLGQPTTAFPPYQTSSTQSYFTYDNDYSWTIAPQINYTKDIGKGKLLATVGGSVDDENASSLQLIASNYTTNLLLSSPTAGATLAAYQPYSVTPQKQSALFGRFNYEWADKYYIDVTGRNDGSSNFGQDRQFHLFAAAGAGWIFSEENLMKDNLPFLSFGKLRASYGSTGRDNISPYSYLSTYSSTISPVTYGGTAGLTPTQLPNPELSWETTKKAELGLELQFLKGRIAFTTDFYRNRTTGVLAQSALPLVTGFPYLNENIPGTVQNQGFDFTLTTVDIKNQDFSWSTTILFTRDRNKLLSYPNLATSPYANAFVIGQPVNIIHAYQFDGVNPQTGLYQFIAKNGSIVSTPNPSTDKTALVNINPDFYGSVQNNITYKQFTLSFLFRFIKQNGRNVISNIGIAPAYVAGINYPTVVLNRWQKPGDVTNIQRYGTGINVLLSQLYVAQSNDIYGDASYIRLQNLSLSYALPQGVAHRLGMQRLQVFLQGENLWTISGYDGLDPETQSFSLPSLRVMTAGLKLTL